MQRKPIVGELDYLKCFFFFYWKIKNPYKGVVTLKLFFKNVICGLEDIQLGSWVPSLSAIKINFEF